MLGEPKGRHGWLAGRAVAMVVVADRGEPGLGDVELAGDQVLDVGVKRGVRADMPFNPIFESGSCDRIQDSRRPTSHTA